MADLCILLNAESRMQHPQFMTEVPVGLQNQESTVTTNHLNPSKIKPRRSELVGSASTSGESHRYGDQEAENA